MRLDTEGHPAAFGSPRYQDIWIDPLLVAGWMPGAPGWMIRALGLALEYGRSMI